MKIELRPIGYVRSPYRERRDAHRQGRLSDAVSEIVVDSAYEEGLLRVGEKTHLVVLCWFDRADRERLRVTPPKNPVEHGVFATRSPDRPNPVSISVVDLLGIKGCVLSVRGLDALDGTPVIDIKPFAPDIDIPGWDEKKGEE